MEKAVASDKSDIVQTDNDKNMDFWVTCPEGEGWGMNKDQFDEMIQEYFDKHF